MYLSRLILNPANRKVWRDISDCHEMHRTIMSGFHIPDKTEHPRSAYGILYRLEAGAEGRLVVYVQSEQRPDWAGLLNEGYLLPTVDLENPAIKSIDEQLGRIANGTILRFRLKANPTKKVGTTMKSERLAGAARDNGRRVPLVGEVAQIQWLNRKAAAAGFRLVSVRICEEIQDVLATNGSWVSGRRRKAGSENDRDRLQFKGVIFDGHLEVTDRAAFRLAVQRGIGSGKAYGFGMLSLAGA